jgi:hypothetical protein
MEGELLTLAYYGRGFVDPRSLGHPDLILIDASDDALSMQSAIGAAFAPEWTINSNPQEYLAINVNASYLPQVNTSKANSTLHRLPLFVETEEVATSGYTIRILTHRPVTQRSIGYDLP